MVTKLYTPFKINYLNMYKSHFIRLNFNFLLIYNTLVCLAIMQLAVNNLFKISIC